MLSDDTPVGRARRWEQARTAARDIRLANRMPSIEPESEPLSDPEEADAALTVWTLARRWGWPPGCIPAMALEVLVHGGMFANGEDARAPIEEALRRCGVPEAWWYESSEAHAAAFLSVTAAVVDAVAADRLARHTDYAVPLRRARTDRPPPNHHRSVDRPRSAFGGTRVAVPN